MTALEIKAIQKLPEEYLQDGTVVCVFGERVVAMNPALAPLIFYGVEWREIKP